MKRLNSFLSLLLCQFVLAACDSAASKDITVPVDTKMLVERPSPLITGVGTHFGIGGNHNYVPHRGVVLINELGVDSYRDDVPWIDFDPDGDGRWNGQPARLFAFMKMASQKPLLVAGYPNQNIEGANPPINAEGRRHFETFIGEVVKATAKFDPIYEIWNEWNMNAVRLEKRVRGAGTPDDPRAATYYAQLAKSALPVARAAAPSATVLYGAVGDDIGWAWAKAMVQEVSAGPDVSLSVHLYNQCEAELRKRTATEMVDRLEKLQAEISPGAPPRPVYVTEFGWPTAKHHCGIEPQIAAANMAQFFLWSAGTPWLKGAWVYQLKNSGKKEDDLEDNFGLYDYDYKPKPEACAVREAVKLIKSSKRYALQRPHPDLFTLQLETPVGMRLVAWTTANTGTAQLIADATSRPTAKLLCNGPLAFTGDAIQIGPEPVILDFPQSGPTELKFNVSG
ncbi:hypothetical protein [Rhizobium sp. RM]|uniref:hypothetical protein n=1 Tax=Rhizobium sp. RM TaxID=2748079 RepID=UPI00110E3C82|nr:hypothetical protein [Rhizobium sp. RM]NWJ23865.1 hypothetical protein [Rhizobium sp. RM]TMV19681.1 hypothetical protein BJG94_14005 [Rhizobium sp. Td3]